MYSCRTLVGAGALSLIFCAASLFLFTSSVRAGDIQPAKAKKLAVADHERTTTSIDDGLGEILNSTPSEQVVSVLVYLAEQEDLSAITEQMDSQKATLQLRHETVVRALQERAGSTQGSIIAYISRRSGLLTPSGLMLIRQKLKKSPAGRMLQGFISTMK